MDGYSGKSAYGAGFGKRGSFLSFRESNREDQGIQHCSRLGCGAGLNSMKGAQIGIPEKLKLPKTFIPHSSRKNTSGGSSKQFCASGGIKKSYRELQNQTSMQEMVVAESSGMQEQIEDSKTSIRGTVYLESSSSTAGIQPVFPGPENLDSAIFQGLPANATEESGCRTTLSQARPRKQLNQQTGSSNPGNSSSSSIRRSVASRNNSPAVKPVSQSQSGNAPKYGLRNLGCTSISDVLPSDSGCNRRTDALGKRYSSGDSSARGNGINGSSMGANLGSLRSGLSGPSPPLVERPLPQPASRRTRYLPTSRDGVTSVRTRRDSSGYSKMMPYEHGDDNALTFPEPDIVPQLPQNRLSIREAAPPISSRSEIPSVCHNSFGRPGSSSGSAQHRPVARPEDSSERMFQDPLMDRDRYRHFNVEGIAEVLLALERIEQNEGLSYEQLMVLETNLFLGGLGFHDQHRDMRLDIDNMSYEELLALEEKMGTVSTALTEEALSNCLQKSIFIPADMVSGNNGRGGDDVKCSVCQEDYVVGDEVGRLDCQHCYHVKCIHQWLRQKNWCPICKSSVSHS